MQHFIAYPTSSTFACGADAVGRRSTRTDSNPSLTTCAKCKAYLEAEALTTFVPGDRVRYSDVRFGHVRKVAEDVIGFEHAVQVRSEYGNLLWFEAATLSHA